MLLTTIALAGNLLAQTSAPSASSASPKAQLKRKAVAMVTGSDGSQTGIAIFGNFTAIAAPSGSLSLSHDPDCTVTLVNGTDTFNPTFTYAQVQLATNYEKVLHSLAQLTSTPDVYAKGCGVNPVPGLPTRPGAFVGTTKNNVDVFAAIGLTYPSFVEGVWVSVRKIQISRCPPFSFQRPALSLPQT